MPDQYINILERIHASYYQLSTAERKVADFVLSQHSQVQFMSITQLADECTVAEATVSRFCRSLGLKGFNAFKLEMARHVATASAGMIPPRRIDSGSLEGRCLECSRLAQEAIQQTLDLVQPHCIEQAVTLFEKASRVLCVGSGGSMILAQECAHLFSTVTNKFVAVTDSHMQMSAVATMTPGDAVILFSYSGATHNGIAVLELAKVRGIPSILVTRYPNLPLPSWQTWCSTAAPTRPPSSSVPFPPRWPSWFCRISCIRNTPTGTGTYVKKTCSSLPLPCRKNTYEILISILHHSWLHPGR